MNALKYFRRQLEKAQYNLAQQESRGATEEVIRNIKKKIGYYEAAVKALEERNAEN